MVMSNETRTQALSRELEDAVFGQMFVSFIVLQMTFTSINFDKTFE